MKNEKSQYIGFAGQYFVAYGLSVRGMSANLTIGNTPNVDILVNSIDGLKSVSIQVKTSENAYRKKLYGHEGYEWRVSSAAINRHSPTFWYAFVDLQENNKTWQPLVFFVPSKWVAEFVLPSWKAFFFFLPSKAKDITLNCWDNILKCLDGDLNIRDI